MTTAPSAANSKCQTPDAKQTLKEQSRRKRQSFPLLSLAQICLASAFGICDFTRVLVLEFA
jgi:hypothetical protein